MKPTIEELKHWEVRNDFCTHGAAAECLGVSRRTYLKWLSGERKPPEICRRLMAYVDRFGKWDQVLRVPESAVIEYRKSLPEAEDNKANRLRSEKLRAFHAERKASRLSLERAG